MTPVCSKLPVITVIGGGVVVIGSFLALRKFAECLRERRQQKRLEERCSQWPKDTVIVHGMRRGKLIPHPSPFVVKLESFLRMHNISYIFDDEFPYGDKGKMPWITYNGEHYADSQIILKFLTSKFNLKPNGNYSESERAVGTMARILVDEHIFWGLLLWRYVHSNGESFEEMFHQSPKELKSFKKMTKNKYTHFSWCQGLGRHSKVDVIEFMSEDFRAISKFIGNKKFLLGDEPCDDDCAVFGQLSQYVWNDVRSPYKRLIENELPNLQEYCLRMKDTFWKDWDETIQASAAKYKEMDS